MNVTVIIGSIAAIYIVIVNLAGFISCGVDKRRAVKGAWRISEKQLMITAALGGSAGILAGMYVFRHKTKHMKFVLGVPVMLVCQAAVIIAVIYMVFIN